MGPPRSYCLILKRWLFIWTLFVFQLEKEILAARKAEIEQKEKEKDKKKQYGAELKAGMEQLYRNRADEKFQVALEQAHIEKEKKEL